MKWTKKCKHCGEGVFFLFWFFLWGECSYCNTARNMVIIEKDEAEERAKVRKHRMKREKKKQLINKRKALFRDDKKVVA